MRNLELHSRQSLGTAALIIVSLLLFPGLAIAEIPLIFIHGIKGATLRDQVGHTKWLHPLQALGLTTPDLALPLAWEKDAQPRDVISATGVLAKVRVFPLLLEQQVYGPWLEAAQGF